PEPRLAPSRSAGLDLADVKGQESAKRALEIAAAGGHNLLMVGPPGAGKSMLAARLPGILPPLEPAEALELGMIQSVAGGLRSGGLSRERPFRDPHHSASLAALVGGGPRPRPAGPLRARIALRVAVRAVSPACRALPPAAEGSGAVAGRVATARARQAERYAGLPVERGIRTNAEADGALLDEIASPDAAGRALLARAAERLRLSARGYHRVMRVARTLADLEGAPVVGRRRVPEAVSYRRLEVLPEGEALRA